MNSKKFLAKALTGAMALAFTAGMAHASVFSVGTNLMEDDSNEYIWRLNDEGQYTLVTTGAIQNGDVLVQILDFPIINSINIDSAGVEVTGIAVNVIQDIGVTFDYDPDGAGPLAPYTAISTFNMVAGTSADWLALTGLDLSLFAFDTTNLISLIFEDAANNLDVFTQGIPQGITNSIDGTLVMALSLLAPTNFISANLAPLYVDTFNPATDPASVPGVTQYGTFNYQLSFAYENLPGTPTGFLTGSGTNLVTDRLSIAAVIDDTQASFTTAQVPEPATLALLGLGLLGMGASLRKRKA